MSLDLTTRNALIVCELAGRFNIPVHAGCGEALSPAPVREPSSHGLDGLGDLGLGPPRRASQSQHAVSFIIESVRRSPGEISLCAIGPMTNIATALKEAPDIASQIRQLVFMGGAAFCAGNTTAAAEFNMWIDPAAAKIVLDAEIPSVMFGLDVTHKAVMTAERIGALRSGTRPVAQTAAALMTSYGEQDPCLHDACAIAYLIEPTLFDGMQAKIDVDSSPTQERGRTRVMAMDELRDARSASCNVMTSVDDDRLFQLLTDRLASL